MLPYLKLMRFPNVFSAFADILLGWLVAKTATAPWTHDTATPDELKQLGLLLLASAGLYLAGMVLNDVFDFDIDAVERSSRPLPSGRIPRTNATKLGWGLLAFGLLAAIGSSLISGQWLARRPPARWPWRWSRTTAA
ncbi:MAG: UbiA family prenyltransferase [Pirellulales bacterium]